MNAAKGFLREALTARQMRIEVSGTVLGFEGGGEGREVDGKEGRWRAQRASSCLSLEGRLGAWREEPRAWIWRGARFERIPEERAFSAWLKIIEGGREREEELELIEDPLPSHHLSRAASSFSMLQC